MNHKVFITFQASYFKIFIIRKCIVHRILIFLTKFDYCNPTLISALPIDYSILQTKYFVFLSSNATPFFGRQKFDTELRIFIEWHHFYELFFFIGKNMYLYYIFSFSAYSILAIYFFLSNTSNLRNQPV